MRGVTNFFLANLAVADLCVGIFCVYQTLTNYIMNSWLLGSFFCKLYMFVHALSYTASIMILVLVCIERYLAIVHPIKCRSILTRSRLRIIVMIVWILAAVYASPRFIYVDTIHHELNSGSIDIICIPNIKKNNKNIFDTVNLIILYLLPLLLMTILYTRIAIGLWKSSSAFCTNGIINKNNHHSSNKYNNSHRMNHVNSSSKNILRARRGVIKMLVAVVFIFAICNLPQQIRIFWLHWDPSYNFSSNFSTILTVSTFLISYMNSCLNPLLYAFLSRNFRRAMKELFTIDKRNPGRFRMGYITGDVLRFDNGRNHTMIPHSSVVRLSSAHDSPVTTQTITRQNTFIKSNT